MLKKYKFIDEEREINKNDIPEIEEWLNHYNINSTFVINYGCGNINRTLLEISINNNALDVVEFLIKKGADINIENESSTPLYQACEDGNFEIVKILVENGADVNYITSDGSTPYEIAAYSGYDNIAEYLINNGANPNLSFIKRGGYIPYARYAWKNDQEAYENAKLDGNMEEPIYHNSNDECNCTVHYKKNVAKEDIPGLFEFAQENNIFLPSKDDKYTWYEYAVNINSIELVEFLLDKGINPYTSSSKEWNTIVEYAAMWGRLNIIKILLEKKYDQKVFLEDDSLIFAANNDFADIVEYLVVNKKNIDHRMNNKSDEYTALRIAAQENNIDTVKLLCKLGANVNIETKYDTALYCAAAEGHLEVVKTLVEFGANINYKNKYGTTPYEIAIKFNNMEIVKYLLDKTEVINYET